jgi:hypothetical protein
VDDRYLTHLRDDAPKAAGVEDLLLDALATVGAGEDAPADPFAAGRLTVERACLLQGLLWNASVIMIDELFEDLEELRSAQRDPAPGTQEVAITRAVHDSLVLSGLPVRYAGLYDAGFVLRFIAASIVVTARVATGWKDPATIAEVLATRLLLDRVETLIRNNGVRIDVDWRPAVEAALYDDAGDGLFGAEDGVADALSIDDAGHAGADGQLDFEEWFTPFRDPPGTAPYATRDSL